MGVKMKYLFPERFQELLDNSSITYDELIKKLGIKSRGTITKYANGQIKNVSISMICKIAEIFEVSPVWLIGWSNNKNYKIVDEKLTFFDNVNDADQDFFRYSIRNNKNEKIALSKLYNDVSYRTWFDTSIGTPWYSPEKFMPVHRKYYKESIFYYFHQKKKYTKITLSFLRVII